MKLMVRSMAAGAVVLSAACSDGGPLAPQPAAMNYVTVEQCETITFNTAAGAADHMQEWGGTTIFGVSVSASGERYADWENKHAEASLAPRLFYSPIGAAVEDDDLQYPASGGECQDCQALDLQHFLVIRDERADAGDPFYGDYRYGGIIQLDFAPGLDANTYYVKSWHAVDDDGGEPTIDLYADGNPVSSSLGTGDATVETVPSPAKVYFTSTLAFEFGDKAPNTVTGSGGVDNVVVCREVELPDVGTRTPGYWKNDKKAWPDDEVTVGGITYERADADDLMEKPTRNDKTYNMFEQLVATKLNLLAGTNPACISEVVAEADYWMSQFGPGAGIPAKDDRWKLPYGPNTMSAAELHSLLDQYNNGQLCAPHAD